MKTSNKKRLLITGVSGLLGNNLAYALKDRYTILGLYNEHPVEIGGIEAQQVDLLKAQDVKEVIPELVSGKEGTYGLSYGQLTAVLVNAMKEQQAQINKNLEEIESLKQEIIVFKQERIAQTSK